MPLAPPHLTRQKLKGLTISGSEDVHVPDIKADTSDDETSNERRPLTALKGKKRSREYETSPDKPKKVARNTSDSPVFSDTSKVTVLTSRKKEDGSRKYDKKFFCFYCSKSFSKMARHLKSMHISVPEVEKAFSCPKGSKERKMQLSLLLNKGNRAHNNQVIKKGTGTVVPRRQPTQHTKADDFVHCINCEGYYKRQSLWRHMKRCYLSQTVKGLKKGTSRVQALCRYAEPVPDNVNVHFWNLVQNMHEDKITSIVKKEKYILKLGEHLFNRHGHDKTKHEYIRQKMRETARLVLQGQEDGSLKTMRDFIVPSNFPKVIRAVQNVAGMNEETNTYRTPSLALKLGHNLKKIASIMECEAMMEEGEELLNNARVFKKLCDTKWSECVSSTALRNLHESKWNTPQLLPVADDIRKMHQHIDLKREELLKNLENKPNKKSWSDLSKQTLCEVILFNRRREGEVSIMTLHGFITRDSDPSNTDVDLALTELEKKLCNYFQRVEIRGKRGRKVPILLTPKMVTSMELLVKTRQKCDILDDNAYMFARPQALTYFRGSDVIRQIALNCGAKNPAALSSTKLRKHVATMSKVLNLKDNEMDDLANFMGHDIRVHREYYRLPEGTLQLAKVSKVLMALEKGQLSPFKGKNLDEIHIDPEEKMIEDSDAMDSENEDPDLLSSKTSEKTLRTNTYLQCWHGCPRKRERERKTNINGRKQNNKHSITFKSMLTCQCCQCLFHININFSPILSLEGSKKQKTKQRNTDAIASTSTGLKGQKRPWTALEVEAVEKTLMDNIETGKVPGKAQCTKCIEASPEALQERDWKGIKFYVKNRIDSLRRESCKRK
ncbi:hypothetical protein WMY93_031796 [Mugilogobius chulae]|uniref:Uncharacterized protein n=1 Tax=Mugilogobius chulae TaxID=88201 RepID=A0AAW0MGQ2_9GOBI